MKINANFSKIQKTFFILIIAFFLLSVILYIGTRSYKRNVFLYESMDNNSIYTEERWMPINTSLSQEQFILEELLLGPKTDRYRPLFQHGTKILFSFKQDKNLVINLSEEAAMQTGSSSKTENACNIMLINIKHLIKGVKNVTFFIGGHQISSESFAKYKI